MTEIKINWIHYKNFKGFKDYKLELNGQSAHAIGPNGSGKTSLANGLPWLFFGNGGYAPMSDKSPQYKVTYNLDGTRKISFRGQIVKTSGNNVVDMEVNSFNVVAVLPVAITPNVECNGYGITNSGNGCRVWAATTGVLGARIGTVKTNYVDLSSLTYIID